MQNGFTKIIADQGQYIEAIKTALNNNHFNFSDTKNITELPEHNAVGGRIIDTKDQNNVFFLTALMYKPDTGWWVVQAPHAYSYETQPYFWFDFGNIFRTPDSYQIGPDVLTQDYINVLNNIFANGAENKIAAIANMCQNIGSKNMDEFVTENTLTHGNPWRNIFDYAMVIHQMNNYQIEERFGIPYFLVGKYVANAAELTDKITFYKYINARWFFMTQAERIGELTRDIQPAIISVIVAEEQRREAERRDAERRDAERRDAERRDAERRDAERRDAERRDAERRDAERRDAERRQRENIIAAIIANQPQKRPKENNNHAILTAIIAAIINSNRESSHDYFMNHFNILILQENEIVRVGVIAKINKIITEITNMITVANRNQIFNGFTTDLFYWQNDINNIHTNDYLMYGENNAEYRRIVGNVDGQGVPRRNAQGVPIDEGFVGYINKNYIINRVNNYSEPSMQQIIELFKTRVSFFGRDNTIDNTSLNNFARNKDSDNFGDDLFGTPPPYNENNENNIIFTQEVHNLKYFFLLSKYVVFFEKWKGMKKPDAITEDVISQIKQKFIDRFNECIKLIRHNQESLYNRLNSNIQSILKGGFYNSKIKGNNNDNVAIFYNHLPGFKDEIVEIFNSNGIFNGNMTQQKITSFADGKIKDFPRLNDANLKQDTINTTTQANTIKYIVTCYYENLKYIIKMINFIKKLKNIINNFINSIRIFMEQLNINNIVMRNIANNDASKQYRENIFLGLEKYVRPPPRQIAIQPVVINQGQQNPVDRNRGRNVNRGNPNQAPAQVNPAAQAVVPVANVAANQVANQAIIAIRERIQNLQQGRINYDQFENLLKNCYKHGTNNYAGVILQIFKSDDDANLNIDTENNKNVLKRTLDLLRQGY